jgi:hypothetical protein
MIRRMTAGQRTLNVRRRCPDVLKVGADDVCGSPPDPARQWVSGSGAMVWSTRIDGIELIAGLEVVAELGRGADSVVRHVRRGGRDYALKVFAEAADPDAALTAFRRDAALLAMIPHPGLPRIRQVGISNGRPHLVTDLVPGRPLSDLLAHGPLPPDVVRGLAVDLAVVLDDVHRRGLAHRAIKPTNVIITPEGIGRLIDFGLAERGGGDRRSDLNSLGVLLRQCLTGDLPFRGEDVGEDVGGDVGVARLLAEDPDDRYPSASALLADLVEADPRLRGRAAASQVAPGGSDDDGADAELVDLALCGRDGELARLSDRWRAVRAEGHGGAVLITGPAGSGKSRLARELAGSARAGGAIVLLTACPDDRHEQSPVAVAGLLIGLARAAGGLLLHLDDVHRLDPASRRVLAELGPRLAGAPLLVVATARSEREHAGGVAAFRSALGAPVHPELALPPLEVCDVRDLIGAVLPGTGVRASAPTSAADRWARLLTTRSNGNPFVVLEYLRSVLDAGLLRPGWDGWELDRAGLDALDLAQDVPASSPISRKYDW